jgi:hypothetical protein
MAFKRGQKIAKATDTTKQNVNLLPAYEQTIAERLEGIEIPDMADAIWGRIAAALDVEMPVHDAPAAPEGTPFFKDPAVWVISAGILAIIIALFILFSSRNTTPPPQPNLPQHTQPAVKPDTIMKKDFKPPGKQTPLPEKNTRPINQKPVADTSAFINKNPDSLLKMPPALIAPPVNTSPPPAIKLPPAGGMKPSIEIPPRKKYGVEVSDSGYRFNMKPKE